VPAPGFPLRLAAVLALGLLAGACAGGPPPPTKPRIDPALAAALEALAHPQSLLSLGGPPDARKIGMPDGTLLNGLTGAEIDAVLGPPSRVRHDPPAQVWQYDQPRCFVDVFLYTDDDEPRAVYVQERSREVKKIAPGACLGAVWQAHQAGFAP
jgi:hypothetical protein